MIENIKNVPWAWLAVLGLAVPMVLLMVTTTMLTLTSLLLREGGRAHVLAVLDRLVALAAVIRTRPGR